MEARWYDPGCHPRNKVVLAMVEYEDGSITYSFRAKWEKQWTGAGKVLAWTPLPKLPDGKKPFEPAQYEISEWNPYPKEAPEKPGWYLVTRKDDVHRWTWPAFYSVQNQYWSSDEPFKSDAEVIAWMPWPEAYTDEIETDSR